MSFLEESWEEREESVYLNIFGDTGEGIYPLTNEFFSEYELESTDPRWLRHGVFKCPPNKERATWAYVTSGMSNPWEDELPQQFSGLGVEFVLETETDEIWAIELLNALMAYNLLNESGHLGENPPLDYGDRIPLEISASINTMMFAAPVNFPGSFKLKSGKVELLQAVGITESELKYAQKTASFKLREIILGKTGGLLTTKERQSVV